MCATNRQALVYFGVVLAGVAIAFDGRGTFSSSIAFFSTPALEKASLSSTTITLSRGGAMEERTTRTHKKDDDAMNTEKEKEASSTPLPNIAFVFVKPHANNPIVQERVKQLLLDVSSLEIQSEGDIAGTVIDENKLIDQHYYAIASKATLLDPHEMAVPAEKFEEAFGETWEEVLQAGRAVNAVQACEKLGLDAHQLEQAWRDSPKVVKFGGGFYCGIIEGYYVFNAFFMTMRSKFAHPEASIHYYVVKWDARQLRWSDFRAKILGPTDPSTAPLGSVRRVLHDAWQELGLAAQPNQGDNGVHASASPFEGLAERMNWLGLPHIEDDEYGKALVDAGVSVEAIRDWSVDPRVPQPAFQDDEEQETTTVGSIFDALEDLDAPACLARCVAISALAASSSAAAQDTK